MKDWKISILCRSFLWATLFLSLLSDRYKVTASSPFLSSSPDTSLRSKRTIDLSFLVRNFLLQSAAVNNQKAMAFRTAATNRPTTNRPATTTTTTTPLPPPTPTPTQATETQPPSTPAIEQPSTTAPSMPSPQPQFQEYRQGPTLLDRPNYYNAPNHPDRPQQNGNPPRKPNYYVNPNFHYVNGDSRGFSEQQMFQQMQMPPQQEEEQQQPQSRTFMMEQPTPMSPQFQQMQMPVQQEEQQQQPQSRTFNNQPSTPMNLPQFQQMRGQQSAQLQSGGSFLSFDWGKIIPWFGGADTTPQTTTRSYPRLPPSIIPTEQVEQQRALPSPNSFGPSLVIRKNLFYQFPPANFNDISTNNGQQQQQQMPVQMSASPEQQEQQFNPSQFSNNAGRSGSAEMVQEPRQIQQAQPEQQQEQQDQQQPGQQQQQQGQQQPGQPQQPQNQQSLQEPQEQPEQQQRFVEQQPEQQQRFVEQQSEQFDVNGNLGFDDRASANYFIGDLQGANFGYQRTPETLQFGPRSTDASFAQLSTNEVSNGRNNDASFASIDYGENRQNFIDGAERSSSVTFGSEANAPNLPYSNVYNGFSFSNENGDNGFSSQNFVSYY